MFLFGWLLAVAPVAAQETVEPLVVSYSVPPATIDGLLRGEPGEAYLLYYLPDKGPEQPTLVARLSKAERVTEAVAEVFAVSDGQMYVPVTFNEDIPSLPDDLSPTIKITAPDGWWVRDGIVNYNLDITVYGQIYAMWAADEWPRLLQPRTPNAEIIVRDVDKDGLPDWDWRTMLPEFPNRGDLRTNYAERKCSSPLTVDPGVSPQWPFVAFGGGFEQEVGIFRPPIVVDWVTGQIKYFSETVTVRNQNCSYSLYSIQRVLPDRLNSANFETPFAFYDLSREGIGHPNLLLRTQRAIKNEPLLLARNPETQSIRYSWRNAVGDWEWDYKVDVMGQYRFDYETPIAGGMALIDAPPYEAYPDWVIGRDWPAVSFVAAEEARYKSSEGIYDWSMLSLSEAYFFGWNPEPDVSQYEDVRTGFRGEYRVRSVHRPETYFSPIDNRLHLKWAEHGIWRLDDEQIIRTINLDMNETIDVWSREAMMATAGAFDVPLEETIEEDGGPMEPEVLETLYALEGYLLHDGNQTVTLEEADYQPALFETLPPTDHDTWEMHRALLAPYEDQRRDPTDLRSWLDAFSGPRSEIAGASVANVRITDDGFRFELALEPGMQVAGTDLLGLGDLPAGQYVVENRDGVFHVAPMAPAQLAIDVQPPAVNGVTQITVGNSGTADATDLELIVEIVAGDKVVVELSREPVDARAGEMARQLVTIPSNIRAGYYLSARLEDSAGETVVVSRPLSLAGPAAEHAGEFTLSRIPVLIPVLGSFSVLLALAALLAVMRRGRQFDI